MQRIVTHTPLHEIWNSSGDLAANRLRYIGKVDIRNLLQRSAYEFVVANIGDEIRWIPKSECFNFWRNEVVAHLAEPESNLGQDQFPNGFCYFASLWSLRTGEEIILLEKHH